MNLITRRGFLSVVENGRGRYDVGVHKEKSDAVVSARAAGLVYVTDEEAGILRKGKAGRFYYVDAKGRRVRNRGVLGRIKALVIPPAWWEVWICAKANGHLQATGRDARGRKQSRYHAEWRKVRDENKYAHMIKFARALPRIRARAKRDLKLRGLPKEKVLAAVVRLLEKTLIRVGNEEYAKTNESFGLTTMRDKHARIRGGAVEFMFRGKSGVKHTVDLEHRTLAKIVKQCQELPGYDLFQYVDEAGKVVDVKSGDVNDYLREVSGEQFTAKDFRTWAGTVLAATALAEMEKFDSEAAGKRNVVAAVEAVAKRLGNTKAVCRKCYIHPEILNAYMDGDTIKTVRVRAKKLRGLKEEEMAVLGMLGRRS